MDCASELSDFMHLFHVVCIFYTYKILVVLQPRQSSTSNYLYICRYQNNSVRTMAGSINACGGKCLPFSFGKLAQLPYTNLGSWSGSAKRVGDLFDCYQEREWKHKKTTTVFDVGNWPKHAKRYIRHHRTRVWQKLTIRCMGLFVRCAFGLDWHFPLSVSWTIHVWAFVGLRSMWTKHNVENNMIRRHNCFLDILRSGLNLAFML